MVGTGLSLSQAADLLDAHPRLGLLAARILVGPEEREDPICAEMAASPLPVEPDDMPGRPVLGFLACAAVVRRSAYLQAGGFDPMPRVGGEEELLAADFASAGWALAYVEDMTIHHHPSTVRDARARRRTAIRNALWFAWLRRPALTAALQTLRVLSAGLGDADAWAVLIESSRSLPWALRKQRVVPPHIEDKLRTLDRTRSPRALTG